MTLSIQRVRDRLHLASRLANTAPDAPIVEEAAGKKKPAAKTTKKEAKEQIEKIGERQVRTLSVFADGRAMKLIQQLYTGYVSETDAGGFTTFMHDMDALMTEHRQHSNAPVNLDPEEDEDEEGEGEVDEDGNPIENDENNAEEDEDGYNGMSESQLKAINRRRREREVERMAEGKTKK